MFLSCGFWFFFSFQKYINWKTNTPTMISSGNLKGITTKNGFSFAGSHLPCRKFIWLEEFLFSFFHWSGITLFSSDLFLFHFLSIFDRESFFFFLFYCSFLCFHLFLFSFFPFLPFLSFHFSFSIPFFGKSGFSILFALPRGDQISLSFALRERMRILSISQGSKKGLRYCQWGLLLWEPDLDI